MVFSNFFLFRREIQWILEFLNGRRYLNFYIYKKMYKGIESEVVVADEIYTRFLSFRSVWEELNLKLTTERHLE